MPKIHIHYTTKSHIAYEPKALLTRLSNSLKSMQNTGDTLKLKNHELTTTPGGLKNLVNQGRYRAEQQDASNYFGGTGEKISIRDALHRVENAIRSKNERPRLEQSVSTPPVATQKDTPSIRLVPADFDAKITKQFLDHIHQEPTPEQKRILNDLCTGLSVVKKLGISPLLPSAGHSRNGTTAITSTFLHKALSKSESFENLPRNLNTNLINLVKSTLTKCSPPEGQAAIAALDAIPPTTKEIMLKLCTFKCADLRSTNLKSANLDGINLDWRKFPGVENIPQHHLKCSGATWTHSRLMDMDINGSDFANTTLTGTNLVRIESEHVNYTDAKFTGAKLIEVNFSNSNFSGADLTGIHIDRVNFSNTNLTGAKISLHPDFLDEAVSNSNIDNHINHLNNQNQGLLVSINSIDPKHEEQRTPLMASVIDRLDRLDDASLTGSWDSLANVLLKESSYAKDRVIARFIQTRLLPQWMESKNQGVLRPDEINLAVVLDQLNASASTVDWSAPQYQGAVNQLLCAATLAPNKAYLHQYTEQLRTTYLNNPAIKEAALAFDAIEEDLARATYIFTSSNGHQVLALEPELFENLVSTAPKTIPWNSAYLITRNSQTEPFEASDLGELAEVYAIQPFLKARYAALMQGEIGRNLVSGVLGNSPHVATFLDALNRNTVQNKLVASAQQDELYDTFAGHWQVAEGDVHDRQNTSRSLRPEHQEQLWQAVNGLGLEDNAHNRAAVMLCLSSMFTRYSSSAVFGTETESPPAVRLYASALLNEARVLDPSLIDSRTATDWQARLLGIGNAFTCTAILSSMMNVYLKDKAQPNSLLETVSLGLYPAAWR